MAESALVSEVREFFDKYNGAFLTRNGKHIADCYHAPTVTMRGDGSIHCLASTDELVRFFQGVVDGYAKEGLGGGRFSNLHVMPIGDRSALATLDWDMLRADGAVIRSWRQSYNLVRVGSAWRILVSTLHISR